jgi:hypothetical protein
MKPYTVNKTAENEHKIVFTWWFDLWILIATFFGHIPEVTIDMGAGSTITELEIDVYTTEIKNEGKVNDE